MNYVFVYITNPSIEHVRKIGRSLIKNRLAACVNIIPKVESIYWWKSKVTEDNEAILIAKTKKSNFKKLKEHVQTMHEYGCPCIVAFNISDGNKDFLKWIDEEIQG